MNHKNPAGYDNGSSGMKKTSRFWKGMHYFGDLCKILGILCGYLENYAYLCSRFSESGTWALPDAESVGAA
jgi:hypothetical protein